MPHHFDQVFKDAGLLPTLSERKVYVKHKRALIERGTSSNVIVSVEGNLGDGKDDSKELVLIVSAHMDDFKAAGTTEELEWLRAILKTHFGENVKMNMTFIIFIKNSKMKFHLIRL